VIAVRKTAKALAAPFAAPETRVMYRTFADTFGALVGDG
jgi:hypothetical protein